MGLNMIEIYVVWNVYELEWGVWDMIGWNDFGCFFDFVYEEGLDVIVCFGFYICVEWYNGGFFVWFIGSVDGLCFLVLDFFVEVSVYFCCVYDIVVLWQIECGGFVVLVQIENEYGVYGVDQVYFEVFVVVMCDVGIIVLLMIVDQLVDQMLCDGSLFELYKIVFFGLCSMECFVMLCCYQLIGFLMCLEFWDGWFDWWGGVYYIMDVYVVVVDFDVFLVVGVFVNIYMFYGGINFVFINGVNDKG